MAVNVVSFSFFWCSTGALRVHSAGRWLSLLHHISIFSGPQFIRASRGPLWPGVAFLTTSCFQLRPIFNSTGRNSNCSATPLARRTQLSYIIVRRPLDLWNRMFNRHQAEITVMQFRGHSLPVHQSMSVPWEFFSSSHFIRQFQPTRFPLITAIRMCHLLPVNHLEWHFCSGWRSKYNTRTLGKTPSLTHNLPIVVDKDEFMPFTRSLGQKETQTASPGFEL